ncbi:unnamed protein product [Linum trigynum]|uniref:Reverse transcriptase n=1 Tax=Linum trigynum TaxID=586398 RepID=A0AAV2FFC5_9ROSI
MRAIKSECEKVKAILCLYEAESGQQVNPHKSELSFSPNVRQGRRKELADLLNMKVVDHHQKYLGLPTIIGRSKKQAFGYLVDQVRAKVKVWKGKLLSVAGKEVLIKVVAQAQMLSGCLMGST